MAGGKNGVLANLRRNGIGHVLHAGFRGLSAVARLHPRAKELREDVEVLRDLPYRDTGKRAHLLDVYRGADGKCEPKPVVLYLHGGGFRILSKDTHWMMALAFAQRGYVVFNANYRLAPKHPYPAAIEDVAHAYRYVIENAERLGGDPQQIIIAGESAGANLSLMLANALCFGQEDSALAGLSGLEDAPIPRALVPLCGIHEVSNHERFSQKTDIPKWVRDRVIQVCTGYLGAASGRPSEELPLANPLNVLEGDGVTQHPYPPVYASCGSKDPILDDTVRLGRALAERGIRHEISIAEGESHAFQAIFWKKAAIDDWAQLFQFLRQTAAD